MLFWWYFMAFYLLSINFTLDYLPSVGDIDNLHLLCVGFWEILDLIIWLWNIFFPTLNLWVIEATSWIIFWKCLRSWNLFQLLPLYFMKVECCKLGRGYQILLNWFVLIFIFFTFIVLYFVGLYPFISSCLFLRILNFYDIIIDIVLWYYGLTFGFFAN